MNNSRILIVEDEDSNFRYIKEALIVSGFKNIVRASIGENAVKTVKEDPTVALVLMDIKMPTMNGLDATATIKKYRKDLPVVAVTAYASPEDEKLCYEAGCDYYLAKPVKMDVLVNIVNKFIKD